MKSEKEIQDGKKLIKRMLSLTRKGDKVKRIIGKVVTIFRVQDDRGLGPYRNENLRDGILASHSEPFNDDYPCPFIEIGRNLNDNEKCGFLSLHYLLNWFSSDELLEMEKNGYHITPVWGKITGVGKRQVFFEEVA